MILIILTGTILKERYCILEKIKQGGGGSLYLARDMELGTLWAIKEIPLSQKKEAELLRLLEHPSLPVMVDYVEKQEKCYLVMEYVKGKSLEDLRKEGKKFSIKEITEIGLSLTDVLEYLHTRKPPVCYGDLKPANIMLTDNGKLYLVDFGSAVKGYENRIQVCSGTKGYAAPEQYEGKITIQSDIYALGKTLKVLCGKRCLWYGLEYPGFVFFLWKCIRRNSKYRYSSMNKVKKSLKKSMTNKKIYAVLSGVVLAVVGLAAGLSVNLQQSDVSDIPENKAFEETLSGVTDLYYDVDFIKGNKTVQKNICKKAEEELQRIMEIYKEEKYQKKLLLMLALNAQMQGVKERVIFYYEQLLVYFPEYESAYGEYGNYLVQTKEMDKCRQLWKKYQEKEKEGVFHETQTENTKRWIDYMKKEERKKHE